MHQIASKFTLLESRLSSQTSLNDRIAKLESKLSSHSDLHTRLNHLESKHSRLESQLQPDPEHDRLITRINAKLDMIESAQRMKLSKAEAPKPTHLGASADSEINFLQDRIERLTALRARYAKEEKELMG
jgi:predicted nuclease with TOPRIM domain